MPLFGDRHPEDDDALRAEVDRMSALTLPQLAGEVMTKGFGPGGPGADGAWALPNDVAGAFIPADSSRGLDQSLLDAVYQVAVEGIQVLEHACLVRLQFSGAGGHNASYQVTYTATRMGRAALEQGTVDRIVAGGSA
jgi:hypothetical protein